MSYKSGIETNRTATPIRRLTCQWTLEWGESYTSRSNSSLSIPQIPEEELEEDRGFYRILLVQAKTKYKKLIVDKSEAVKNIMKLNTEIKWAHEIIASEISNFLKFRTEFLRFGIKRYINEEVKNLKQRNVELSKVLYNIKHRK